MTPCIRRQGMSDTGEVGARQRTRHDEHSGVRLLQLSQREREGDEVIPIAGHETATVGSGETQLLLIRKAVTAHLVRAQDVEVQVAGDFGDPRREVFVEAETYGERVVVRVGTAESGGARLVADLYVRPGGAVAGEHVHPAIAETFTVVRGQIGVSLDGRLEIAGPGRQIHVLPGVAHDWWNAGEETAHVRVDLSPGAARFEAMILNLFNLARDGKTAALRGDPHG